MTTVIPPSPYAPALGAAVPSVAPPVRAGARLPARDAADIRRRMMLNCCKWDPQIGDANTLADFPLVLSSRAWATLSQLAESAGAELLEAERELLSRPDLHATLGISHAARHALRAARYHARSPVDRIMRFDFHWTMDGWRASEVNSDVPGGFTESSSLPQMMRDFYGPAVPAGDPAGIWVQTIALAIQDRPVALLSAPGYVEDAQVVAYLASRLRKCGMTSVCVSPGQIRFDGHVAVIECPPYRGPAGAVVRFFQAEWLPKLPARCGWPNYFGGSVTPIFNPATAILTESKRLPLVWDQLRTPMRCWKSLLPESRDARGLIGRRDEGWIFKTALCNNGDTVVDPRRLTPRERIKLAWHIRLHGRRWLAQRRFETVPIDSPVGPIYPCIGVYVVDGRVAGAYGRFASGPVIDYAAVDAAVFIDAADRDEQ
jgi:hypothetical protein